LPPITWRCPVFSLSPATYSKNTTTTTTTTTVEHTRVHCTRQLGSIYCYFFFSSSLFFFSFLLAHLRSAHLFIFKTFRYGIFPAEIGRFLSDFCLLSLTSRLRSICSRSFWVCVCVVVWRISRSRWHFDIKMKRNKIILFIVNHVSSLWLTDWL
jgi:hypothetical protein